MAGFLQVLGGAAQSVVCGVATVAGTVTTGAMAGYGAVSGDWGPAEEAAEATRETARGCGRGFEHIGHGTESIGRTAVTVLDYATPVGPIASLAVGALAESPNLQGYPYACAKASQKAYDEYSSRTSFTDQEGDVWTEVHGSRSPVDYNTTYITVYKLGSTIIIAARGTQGWEDVPADAEIAFGQRGHRLSASLLDRCREFQAVVHAFHRSGWFSEIYLAGHSLGGTIAMRTALACGFKAHVFNPGAGILSGMENYAMYEIAADGRADVTVHRLAADLVSTSISGGPNVRICDYRTPKPSIDAHSLSQFLGPLS